MVKTSCDMVLEQALIAPREFFEQNESMNPGISSFLVITCLLLAIVIGSPGTAKPSRSGALSLQAASFQFSSGDLKNALQSCEQLLSEKNDADVFFLKARVNAALERLAEADKDLAHCLELSPARWDAVELRADVAWALNDRLQSARHFITAIDRSNGSCDAHKKYCSWLIRRRWYEELYKQSQKALKDFPNVPEFWAGEAVGANAAGDFKQSNVAAAHAISLKPDRADLYCTAAELLARQGNVKAALELLDEASKKCRDAVVPHYGRMTVYDLLQDDYGTKEERKLMARVVPVTREDIDCLRNFTPTTYFKADDLQLIIRHYEGLQAHFEKGFFSEALLFARLLLDGKLNFRDDALRLQRQLIDRYPSSPAFACSGHILGQFGEPDEALRSYSRGCQVNPFESLCHIARARVYLRTNEYKKALPDLSRAALFDPDNSIAYDLRAQALCLLGRKSEIDKDLAELGRLGHPSTPAQIERRSAQFTSDYRRILVNFGVLSSEEVSRDIKEMETALQRRQCKVNVDESAMRLQLADLYTLNRLFDKALAEYNKAIEKDSGNFRLYSKRGAVFFAMGKKAQAKADRDTAKRLFAQHRGASPP